MGAIGAGLLVFLGVAKGDTEEVADWLIRKLLTLRIFPGSNQPQVECCNQSSSGNTSGEIKPMDRSVTDVSGAILIVSQFTLEADTSRGNRPGFSTAAPPAEAEKLYDYFVRQLRCVYGASGKVATGQFGADMQVQLINDGPVTFLLEKTP